jgi:hypothetical protein
MYNYKEIDKFIERYSSFENSTVIQIREGILGSGDWICTAPNKKTAIIKEIFVNEWNSTHTLKLYNKTPKKYINLINNN